jgi:hypothetical protein
VDRTASPVPYRFKPTTHPGPYRNGIPLPLDAPDPVVRVFSYLSTAPEFPAPNGNPLPHFPSRPNGTRTIPPLFPCHSSTFSPTSNSRLGRQAVAITRRSPQAPPSFFADSSAVEHPSSSCSLEHRLTCTPGADLQNKGLAVDARHPEISGCRPLLNQDAIKQGNGAINLTSSHRFSSTISPSSKASGTPSPTGPGPPSPET